MPFFSIIIPTFNSSEYIAGAIQSLTTQTFADFEILIMDGASTDNTLAIVEQFHDKRIQIYSGADCGVYDAMNKGIKKAVGKWLFFLGSDDTLYNGDVLKNANHLMLLGNSIDVFYGSVFSSVFNSVYDGPFTSEKILNRNICHQSIFFNPRVFKEIGFYNTGFKVFADWDHNLKWFLSQEIRTKYIDLIIANYADGGLSARFTDANFLRSKNLHCLIYGRLTLGYQTKLNIFKREIKKTIRNKDIKMLFLALLNLPRIFVTGRADPLNR